MAGKLQTYQLNKTMCANVGVAYTLITSDKTIHYASAEHGLLILLEFVSVFFFISYSTVLQLLNMLSVGHPQVPKVHQIPGVGRALTPEKYG